MLDQNNNDAYDEKPAEKTIFIDRIIKLALEDKIFTDQNVIDELKTILLAVCNSIIFNSCVSDTRYMHVITFFVVVFLGGVLFVGL